MKPDYITVTPWCSSWRSCCNHSCLMVLKVREEVRKQWIKVSSFICSAGRQQFDKWLRRHLTSWTKTTESPLELQHCVSWPQVWGHSSAQSRSTDSKPVVGTSIITNFSSPNWEDHLFMELTLFTKDAARLKQWNTKGPVPFLIQTPHFIWQREEKWHGTTEPQYINFCIRMQISWCFHPNIYPQLLTVWIRKGGWKATTGNRWTNRWTQVNQ